MSEPKDHHYLPQFYLSRWATTGDGKICRFSRPTGEAVKGKRVPPKGTGFEPGLYEDRGAPPDRAQAMEKDFLAKLDTKAADALCLLEKGLAENAWPPEARSSWSRFMLTQMLRAPEDIAQLKSSVSQEWSKAIPELVQKYVAAIPSLSPDVAEKRIALETQRRADEFALDIARRLMDHSHIGRSFNNMHWLVLDIPEEAYPLLTSDRPIWMTATLTEEDAAILMPIGPRKLFTAVRDRSTQHRLKGKRPRDLVKSMNKVVVQHAVKYVYGETNAMMDFIDKHMSTRRHSSWLERLAVQRGLKI